MLKKMLLATLLSTNVAWTFDIGIECGFAAETIDGDVAFEEYVPFSLVPGTRIIGDFNPYTFKITALFDALVIAIYLEDELIDEQEIPSFHIANVPLGFSIFLDEMFVEHDEVDDLIAIHYDCIRAL